MIGMSDETPRLEAVFAFADSEPVQVDSNRGSQLFRWPKVVRRCGRCGGVGIFQGLPDSLDVPIDPCYETVRD